MKEELIHRMTTQRKVILDGIKNLKTHPTADELYKSLRETLPHISLGTVYRNLEILSESGLIQKLETGGLQKRFDGNPENHYHIRCKICSSIDDIEMEMLSFIENSVVCSSGYEIIGHRLEFIGICPKCNKKRV